MSLTDIIGVRYEGFVGIDTTELGTNRPGPSQIEQASRMLDPKNLKATRKIHPLWARAIKSPIDIKIGEDRLIANQPIKKAATVAKLFEIPFRRIACVASIQDDVYIICRIPDVDDYNCHKIKMTKGEEQAQSWCQALDNICKSKFKSAPSNESKAMTKTVSNSSLDYDGFGDAQLPETPPPSSPIALMRPKTSSTPAGHRRLSGIFGFGEDSQLDGSMLDIDSFKVEDGAKDTRDGIPASWLSAELPRHVNKLFVGFQDDSKLLADQATKGGVLHTLEEELMPEQDGDGQVRLRENQPSRSRSCRLSEFGYRLDEEFVDEKQECSLCMKTKEKSEWVRLEKCGCSFHAECMAEYRVEAYNICPKCHKTIGEKIYYLSYRGSHVTTDGLDKILGQVEDIQKVIETENKTTAATLKIADDCITIENMEEDFNLWIQCSIYDVLHVERLDHSWVLLVVNNKQTTAGDVSRRLSVMGGDLSQLSFTGDLDLSALSLENSLLQGIPEAARIIQAFVLPSEFEAIAFHDGLSEVVKQAQKHFV